mgnify:CR=1 FL=1
MTKNLIPSGKILKNIYEVDCLIAQGAFGEVYRVKHKYLGYQALKILRTTNHEDNFDEFINESKNLININHENIVRLYDSNYLKYNKKKYFYLSMEFVSGEDLFSLIKRKGKITLELSLKLQKEVCQGLQFMHDQEAPIIHRDIKPQNILLNYNTEPISAKISDFGVSAVIDKNFRVTSSAGTLCYMSLECLNGIADASNDLFSAGIIFYEMLTGHQPWEYDFDNTTDYEKIKTQIILARKDEPTNPSFYNKNINEKLEKVMLKAIAANKKDRYKDAKLFLEDLNNYDNVTITKNSSNQKNNGIGFQGIAGMNELKEMLIHEVVAPMTEKDKYAKYKITLPNGILLYGPPGCGKTFIAKKLSEEIDFSFFELRPSDFASTYIHGTQAKIGQLFDKARNESPSIIFIDETDALIPKRTDNLDHHFSSEVNEFLTQLDNCSEDGILVIGTTNRPSNIDPAALRTGRFDKKIYVPNPDSQARAELFNMYLSDRPLSDDINTKLFASATDGYSASDIKEITNMAAKAALRNNVDINFKLIIDAINKLKSSLSSEIIKEYQKYSF